MIKAIVIEDELPAMEYLVDILAQVAADVQVVKVLTSVEESVEYLKANGDVDLILSDVQLQDGASFSIFQQVKVTVPVLFITAYERYMLEAFEAGGIMYVLKPFGATELKLALDKFRNLKDHFGGNRQDLSVLHERKAETRIIVKKEDGNLVMPLKNVALIYTQGRKVYVLDNSGSFNLSTRTLVEHEATLDPQVFFKINRQMLVNIQYVKGYKTVDRVKLRVELTIPNLDLDLVISQDRGALFKNWLVGAYDFA